MRRGSALDGALHDAGDELAAGEDEQDDEWDGGRDDAGHDQGVVLEERGLEQLDRDRQGRVGGSQDDEGPEEVRPGGDEREEAEHRGRGPGGRQRDVPERLDQRAAVDAGRLDELVGQGALQVLRHPEHPEGGDHAGDDDGLELTDPAELGHQDEQRDHAELGRDGHRRDDEDQQRATPTEPQLGEGEPGQGREEHDRQRGDARDEQRVAERLPELDVGVEHPTEVGEQVSAGQQRGDRVLRDGHRVGGRQEHREVDRVGRDRQDQTQQGVGEPLGPAFGAEAAVAASAGRAGRTPPGGLLDRGHGGLLLEGAHQRLPPGPDAAIRRVMEKLMIPMTTMIRNRIQATAEARPKLFCAPHPSS